MNSSSLTRSENLEGHQISFGDSSVLRGSAACNSEESKLDVYKERHRTSSDYFTVVSSSIGRESSSGDPASMVSRDVSFSVGREFSGNMERLRTTLTDFALLRGTRPGTLTEWFGYRLKNGAGGLAAAGVGDFNKSFVVKRLHTFMSHSWHAPWLAKYFALLFHFNSKAAIVFIAVAGILSYIEVQLLSQNNMKPLTPGLHVFLGLLVLFTIIFMWQHLGPSSGRCTRSVFFDQVCIHQVDPDLKTRGIRAIGAMVAHSDSLLVLWDASYFTRLWCVYEISVFKMFKPHGSMTIIPVELGTMVIVVIVAYSAHIIVARFLMHAWGFNYFYLVILTEILLYVTLMPAIFRFLRASRTLQEQLSVFSVCNSLCFCCTNNHVHPVSHETIPCDRELVYEAIKNLYGDQGGQNGLGAFDTMVQSKLFEDVSSSMGRPWLMPLSWAQVLGLPYFLSFFDTTVDADGICWCSATIWTQRLMLNGPIYAILVLGICHIAEPWCLKWAERSPHIALHLAVACFISVASVLLEWLHFNALDPPLSCSQSALPSIGLTAIEALIVFWAYSARAKLLLPQRDTSLEMQVV